MSPAVRYLGHVGSGLGSRAVFARLGRRFHLSSQGLLMRANLVFVQRSKAQRSSQVIRKTLEDVLPVLSCKCFSLPFFTAGHRMYVRCTPYYYYYCSIIVIRVSSRVGETVGTVKG